MSVHESTGAAPELAIRGGTVVDGTGGAPYRADVGIAAGRITAIGPTVRAPRELDASGALVCPGFLDLHTHYDPQVLWDPWLTPTSWQGVTGVVAGNCGLSMAPCPPDMRGSLLRILEHVEDMPLPALEAGVDWTFTSYPEYLGRVRRAVGINFGGYVGHNAVRLHAMGEAAHDRAATPDEIDRMRTLVADALRAGALGFSTDRSGFHIGDRGRPVPSMNATQDEVEALMAVTAEVGRGICHVAPGEDFAWLYDFQPRLGRPITWSALLTYPEGSPRAPWSDKLAVHRAGREAGADVRPQVTCRPIVQRFSLADPSSFYSVPVWGELAALDTAGRVARYRDPAWRERAFRDLDSRTWVNPRWADIEIAESTAHTALIGRRVADLAAERGTDPLAVMIGLALDDDLRTRFGITFANDDEAALRTLLTAEGCVLGLSDAGAHTGQICDAQMPVDYLAHWVRDRGLTDVATGIHRLTGEPAALLGLADRGRIAAAAAADIAVLDWDALRAMPPRRAADAPAGGERLVADPPPGLVHVLVNGTPIRLDGADATAGLTALPGRLLAPA
ncbi:N-acyl-D-amino-acid deacylase family protein [Uniformispora flossi]|uniref:N-acyl-D-amino-acid deacylase family protein n=1 Tax=Uniformispora flossi TaxID=3390723 RepID=UPI003C2CE45F